MKKIIGIIKFLVKSYRFNKNKKMYDYLDKFTDSLNTLNQKLTVQGNPQKYIWMMWLQGEDNAPDIVKKCINSVKKFHSDKQIILLDDKTINDYVDIPDYIQNKYKQGIILPAHYTDYARICLLAKYGGLWIDSTVLLTDKIPDEIFNQEFFIFKEPSWLLLNKIPIKKLKIHPLLINTHCGSNWFINSVPDCTLIHCMKECLEKYWKTENKAVDYFFFHAFMDILLINNPELAKYYTKSISFPNTIPHLLYNILYKPFDIELFNEIKAITPIHKLTYKFGKIPQNSFAEYLIKEYKND